MRSTSTRLKVADRTRSAVLRRRLARDPVGFNFFAYMSSHSGLGEAARNLTTTLQGLGCPIAVSDIDNFSGRSGLVLTHCSAGETSGHQTPHPVNIFLINPAEGLGILRRHPSIGARDRLNTCVMFWEFQDFPADVVEFLQGMDLVLTPTEFIAGAVMKEVPGVACTQLPMSVPLRSAVYPDRSRWGLPEDSVVFLATFDFMSDPNRKNPHAVIRAFQMAFPDTDGVRLVLKFQPVPASLASSRDSLIAMANHDPRIQFMEISLSTQDLTDLCASADVYVSLHRSEGLGLGLMESLSLGVPVIATGYSGPRDFLTDSNSVMLPYTLIPVAETHAYPDMLGLGVWADVDLDSAAVAMRRLADNPSERQRLGTQGRADMDALRAKCASGAGVSHAISVMRTDRRLWSRHPEAIRRLRSISPPPQLSAGALRHLAAVRVKRLLGIPL